MTKEIKHITYADLHYGNRWLWTLAGVSLLIIGVMFSLLALFYLAKLLLLLIFHIS